MGFIVVVLLWVSTALAFWLWWKNLHSVDADYLAAAVGILLVGSLLATYFEIVRPGLEL